MEEGNGCSFSGVALIASLVIFVATLFLVRILYVIYWRSRPFTRRPIQPVSTLIVLGSGGHTAEMLNLLAVLQKDRFYPRFYIAAATDNMSLQKAQLLENSLAAEIVQNFGAGIEHTLAFSWWTVAIYLPLAYMQTCILITARMVSVQNGTSISDAAKFMQIYRSREVGQSYITSIWTTLIALMHALRLMTKIRPQMIICNGPGTCIPLCAIAFLYKLLGIRWSSIFYVESIARVRKLSLSGLLLYKLRMADQLFVQWPQLQQKYPRAAYVGRLM